MINKSVIGLAAINMFAAILTGLLSVYGAPESRILELVLCAANCVMLGFNMRHSFE